MKWTTFAELKYFDFWSVIALGFCITPVQDLAWMRDALNFIFLKYLGVILQREKTYRLLF
jgi:hypothetical protein